MMSDAPSYDDYEPTSEQASETLSNVDSEDTTPEMLLRKELWSRGLHYRVNYDELPGKPDVVFTGDQLAVFCDGDFWHGRNWPELREKLKNGSNPGYWVEKIKTNRERDHRQTEELEEAGWTVVRIWESEIKDDPSAAADRVEETLAASRGHE